MQCDICFRTGGKKLPFLCPTDARNSLYEPRIQHAHMLLEKAAVDDQVAAILSRQDEDEATYGREDVNILLAEEEQIHDRTFAIIASADELREKVQAAREDIKKKKARLDRRKSELASASNGTENRRARQTGKVERALRMTNNKWERLHDVTASSRRILCGEAAKLYGLRRVRKHGGLEEYKIGGISIVDLRHMNTATPAQISTALSHIVHLLMLCTHYLAIRLPAEIILPHRDFPLPTIFPLASSYKYTDVPISSLSERSSSSSPTSSRLPEQATQPRPRPLYIGKPLPSLWKEDPGAHGLFLEGIVLLAYNVTWLCKSQGVPVGNASDFDNICNIGRNIFDLFVRSQYSPQQPSRKSSAQSAPTKTAKAGDNETEDKVGTKLLVGYYSHGTAHSFLGGTDGTEFIRSWKLPNPMKLTDNLKALLLGEVAAAEWEVLNQDSWADDEEMGNDGVVVGDRREGKRANQMLGMQSFMSMRTVVDAVEILGTEVDRKPRTVTSGWTKLKARGDT
ncbi:UV radiation resistance protein and autophagy-related subunit 14-domain-containing protein [Calycina marina]|uniref:Autophagy-related protein 14 n=1 Tax=Calycina marina TaxID=1763456 RepID=A0A9P7ZA74_9HELO|nr:UV radiation resistance protein and autophagy-related subunit 14-domain-containing protein [Calycina marina]